MALRGLAWIAAGDVQSVERHRELITGGAAWTAVDATDEPIGFINAEMVGATCISGKSPFTAIGKVEASGGR